MLYEGRQIGRGRHHVPVELLAIRNAMACLGPKWRQLMEAEADPTEVIRADQWKARAQELAALAGAQAPRSVRRPVRLECGHIRMVRPNTRLGGLDQVNCGPCGTHRGVREFLEQGDATVTMDGSRGGG